MEDLVGARFYFISDPMETFKVLKHDREKGTFVVWNEKENTAIETTSHEMHENIRMEIIKFIKD